eukprot:IDg22596t1
MDTATVAVLEFSHPATSATHMVVMATTTTAIDHLDMAAVYPGGLHSHLDLLHLRI